MTNKKPRKQKTIREKAVAYASQFLVGVQETSSVNARMLMILAFIAGHESCRRNHVCKIKGAKLL